MTYTPIAATIAAIPQQYTYLGASGTVSETLPRWVGVGNIALLTSGQLAMFGVPFVAGQVVTNVSFQSRTTAISAATNWWFGLFDSSRNMIRLTSDQTSTAWNANTVKTLALSSSYTIPTTGYYYLGIMVAASTVPTLTGVSNATGNLVNITPILGGNSSSASLTTPASCPSPAGAITGATVGMPYAYAS